MQMAQIRRDSGSAVASQITRSPGTGRGNGRPPPIETETMLYAVGWSEGAYVACASDVSDLADFHE